MSGVDEAARVDVLLQCLHRCGAPVEGLASALPTAPPTLVEPVLGEFLMAFLTWETTSARAAVAIRRITNAVVDLNEFRVCLPDEIVGIIGDRYAMAAERAERLRVGLNEIYRREHSLSLAALKDAPKRDARAYLESVPGAPPYVSARVLLLSLGAHAAPVDSRIARALAAAGLIGSASQSVEGALILERRIRAGMLRDAYLRLQAWADSGADRGVFEALPDGECERA